MTSGPIDNPAPRALRVSGGLVGFQAAGLLALAAVTLFSGLRHDARLAQLLAQCLYFVVLALLVAAVASGLVRGRRWSRTPGIVVQIVVVAIGIWMAVPSGQIRWGVGLIVLGGVTGGLLLTPAVTAWVKRFPPLFGPAQDR